MAFPTSLAGLDVTWVGTQYRSGPFCSSAGSVYGVFKYVFGGATLRVIKATDPSTSFALAGDWTNAGGNQADAVSVFQVGDVLHVLVANSGSTGVYYNTYNMTLDLWGAEETVLASGNSVVRCSVVVLSSGEVVAFYNGATQAIMGNAYQRVYYKVRAVTGIWGSQVQVDAGGSITYYTIQALLGASDRTHFFYQGSGSAMLHRSLSSGQVLDTAVTGPGMNAGVPAMLDGTSYTDGSTVRLRMPYTTNASPSVPSMAMLDSMANPTFTTEVISPAAHVANKPLYLKNDGTTLHAMYADFDTSDIWRDSSVNNGGAWGTDIEVVDAVNVGTIWARIFTRAGGVKLAYIYYNADNTTLWYDEVSLSGGPGAVGKSTTLRWNVRSAVTRDRDLRWAVRTSAGLQRDLRWAVRVKATKDSSLRWNVRGAIAKLADLRWAVRTKATRDRDLRWAVRTSAGLSRDLRWRVRGAVGKAGDLRWHVRAALGKAGDLRWAVRTKATRDRDLRWSVRTSAGKTSDLRWRVRSAIGKSTDLRWGVRTFVAKTAELRWDVLTLAGAVGKSADLRWAVRATVAKVSDARWAVRTKIAKDRDLRWAVRTAAGKASDLRWAVRGRVTRDRDLRWAVRSLVTRDRDLRWAVRTKVTKDRSLVWHVRTLAAKVSDLRWAVRSRATKDRDLRWAVRTSAAKTSDLRWRVRAAVGKAATLLWNVGGGSIGKDASLRWHVRAPVQTTKDLRWHVRAMVPSTADLRWRLGATTAKTATLRWDVRTPQGKASSLLWSVRSPVGQSATLLWTVEMRPEGPGTVSVVWRNTSGTVTVETRSTATVGLVSGTASSTFT